MEETKSPLRVIRPARSAGGRTPTKGQKEAMPQKDNMKTGGRGKEGASRAKEEGQGGGGRTSAGSPQDQGRSNKSRRLTGRTNSGERGKGKQAEGRQQGHDGRPAGRSGTTRGPAANQALLSTPQENHGNGKPSRPATAKDRLPGEQDSRRSWRYKYIPYEIQHCAEVLIRETTNSHETIVFKTLREISDTVMVVIMIIMFVICCVRR